jgi:hypothetical protein
VVQSKKTKRIKLPRPPFSDILKPGTYALYLFFPRALDMRWDLLRIFYHRPTRTCKTARAKTYSPTVEELEKRIVPVTFTVRSNLDDGPNTLRAQIAAASTGDTIEFAPGLAPIVLANQISVVDKNLIIDGQGNGILISTNSAPYQANGRAFSFTSTGRVAVSEAITGIAFANCGLNVANGGAIFSSANLALTSCQFSSNDAASGGAVALQAGNQAVTLNVTGCTFRSNSAASSGGAL